MSSLQERRKQQLLRPYSPPSFISASQCGGSGIVVPAWRVKLANLPTPVEHFPLPELPQDIEVIVKRDDLTGGIELTGNKVRKLEFLLADAIANDAEVVLTAGGTQSNHARATAAACLRLFHLKAHLILRQDSALEGGNYLLDQLAGADIENVPAEEWARHPSDWLERAAAGLEAAGRGKVYPIPIGGSTPLGCWGYVECINETIEQLPQLANGGVSHVCLCTGSAGTLVGTALGLDFAASNVPGFGPKPQVVGYSVCDSEDWFYNRVDELTAALPSPSGAPRKAKELVRVRDVQGRGYAKSTVEELQFISRVFRETGLITDSCYTGKAMLGMWRELKEGAVGAAGKRTLFVHTGGGPSVFSHSRELLEALK